MIIDESFYLEEYKFRMALDIYKETGHMLRCISMYYNDIKIETLTFVKDNEPDYYVIYRDDELVYEGQDREAVKRVK